MVRRRSAMSSRRGSGRRRSFSNRSLRSNRKLTLLVIAFIFTLTLAPPLKHYFTQRAQIQALKSQLNDDRSALAKAREELQLWRDPDYVKSQARERLHFVLPGERQYIVTDANETDANTTTTKVADNVPTDQPWYTRMIASITETGGA